MYLSGLNAIITIFLVKKIPYRDLLYPSIIFGILIPDLDAFINFTSNVIPNITLLKNTITHSLFSALIVYLLILIISEFFKIKNGEALAKGIILGIIFHILVDISIRGQRIHVLWPLPIGNIKIVDIFVINDYISRFIMPFEFLFFRLYAWALLNLTIINQITFNKFTANIHLWMKIELALFLLFFIGLNILEINLLNSFFEIAYILSLIVAMLFTFFMYKSLNVKPKELVK